MKKFLLRIPNFLALVAILTIASIMLSIHKAEAANITVASGTDSVAVDSVCGLSEAISNINDGVQTNTDCIAGDGNKDTITLPAGTITLSGDLPTITESINIIGQGMNSSVINGAGGLYRPIAMVGNTLDTTMTDFKITAALRGGIYTQIRSANVARVEIDGTNSAQDMSIGGNIGGMYLSGDNAANSVFNVEDVYKHDIVAPAQAGVYGFLASTRNGNTATVSIQKVTIARLSNTDAVSPVTQVNGFNLSVGQIAGPPSNGYLNATISNVTVDEITNDYGIAIGFGAVANADSGESNVDLNVRNVTLTRVQGQSITPAPGSTFSSLGLYAASAAIGVSDQAKANITTRNLFIANNTSDGFSSSCGSLDLTETYGGVGNPAQTISSAGHNLSDDSTCTSLIETGDQQNLTNLESTVEELAYNGGLTPTRALLPGSPAIGAGAAVLGISTDQRGIARPSNPDIGAYQTVLGTSTETPVGSTITGVGVPNTGIAQEGYFKRLQPLIIGSIALLVIAYIVRPSKQLR